jgi:hypothetical protein
MDGLDLLERKRWLRPVPAFPGVRSVDVTSKRLERIMTMGQGCRRRAPWWCWVLALLRLPESVARQFVQSVVECHDLCSTAFNHGCFPLAQSLVWSLSGAPVASRRTAERSDRP